MARKKRKVSVRKAVHQEIMQRAERDTPSWPEHQHRARSEDQRFPEVPPGRAVHPDVGRSMAMAPSGLRDAMVGRSRVRRKRG